MHPSLSCLSCAGRPVSFATYLPQHGAVAAGDAMGGGGRCHGRVHGRVSDAMAVSEDASVLPCACMCPWRISDAMCMSADGVGGPARAEQSVCVSGRVSEGCGATHVYVRPAAAPRAASCRAFSASACSMSSDEGGPAAEARLPVSLGVRLLVEGEETGRLRLGLPGGGEQPSPPHHQKGREGAGGARLGLGRRGGGSSLGRPLHRTVTRPCPRGECHGVAERAVARGAYSAMLFGHGSHSATKSFHHRLLSRGGTGRRLH